MKFEPTTRALQFHSDEELERFHTELTALLREVVTAASGHGNAEEGKLAARSVFKDVPSVMRALNVLRQHLTPLAERSASLPGADSSDESDPSGK